MAVKGLIIAFPKSPQTLCAFVKLVVEPQWRRSQKEHGGPDTHRGVPTMLNTGIKNEKTTKKNYR